MFVAVNELFHNFGFIACAGEQITETKNSIEKPILTKKWEKERTTE